MTPSARAGWAALDSRTAMVIMVRALIFVISLLLQVVCIIDARIGNKVPPGSQRAKEIC
jgi:hypothetical protein